jgi:hypothetical protein
MANFMMANDPADFVPDGFRVPSADQEDDPDGDDPNNVVSVEIPGWERSLFSLTPGGFQDKLLLRVHAVRVWDIVWDELEQNKDDRNLVQRFVVRGSPGTGKSRSMSYLLWKAIRAGRTVVYECRLRGKTFVFLPPNKEGGSPFNNESDEKYKVLSIGMPGPDPTNVASQLLDDPNVLYLVDPDPASSRPPFSCEAQTVIAASPKRDHTKGWEHHMLFIMPVWALEEVLSANKLFGCLTVEQVTERFAAVNGAPRWLFCDQTQHDDRKSDTADRAGSISSRKLMDILKGDGMPIDEASTPSAIVSCERLRVAKPGNYSVTAFRSRLTSRLALYAVVDELGESIIDALENSGVEDSTLMGHLFEALAINALASNEFAKWKTRELDNVPRNGFQHSFNIKNSERVKNPENDAWTRWANVVEGEMLVPESRSFPVVDALLCDFKATQMTIGEDHPISSNGLETMFKHVKKKRVKLYFVVPWYRYKNFKKQNSENKANHKLLAQVSQFAVELTKEDLKKSLMDLKNSGELQRQLTLYLRLY